MKKLLLLLTLISRFSFGQGSISTEYNSTTKKSYLKTGVFPKANVVEYSDTSSGKSPYWKFLMGRIKFKNLATTTDTSLYNKVLVISGDSAALMSRSFFGGGGSFIPYIGNTLTFDTTARTLDIGIGNNTAGSTYSSVYGQLSGLPSSGSYNYVWGEDNTISSGSYNTILNGGSSGYGNKILGGSWQTIIGGDADTIYGGGNNNTISGGEFVSIKNGHNAFANGFVAQVKNAYPWGAALGSYVYTDGSYAMGMGYNSLSNGQGSVAWGHVENWNGLTSPSGVPYTLSSGKHAFNLSTNSTSQITGHGALADFSFIAGGVNSHIPSTSKGSVVLGGYGQKARANDSNQVYMPNMNLTKQPLNDDTLSTVLVRDKSTGQIKYRAASSFGGGGGGGTTTNPVAFNNSGSGDASGTTFNGSASRTISYNSVGAAPATTGTSLLKANGSGGFSDADSASVYNAIGSKPANRFIASPSTTSGNATARYISQPDLNYLYERIGVVISDNFSGTFSTNWSTTGSATATNSGGKMSITGTSTKSLGNYFLWKTYSDNNKTCATNTTSSFDVDIPASTTTSFGVGFRLGGTSLNIQSCILLNNASRGKLVFYFNGDTSTAITSNAALSVTTGDVVTLKLTRTRNTFTLTARIKSGTNVNQEISHILNIENNNPTTYRTPNAGAVGINSLGGNFTLDNFSYSIDDTKYNKVLVLGNSIASGSRSNSQSQTFPARLGDLIGYSASINAGGGNLISDINATEALLYQDQIIVIELGTNDLLSGTSAATIKLKLDTLIGKLTGYTTSNNKLFILSLLPNNTVDVTATNTLLAASYGTAFIDVTKPFNNTSGTGINPYYSPDGTHPTSEGAFFIADCIFQKINPYLNISYNHKAYDNPVYRINGNTSMGNYDQIANYACDIFKSDYTKQFRIGYTESSNDGLVAWSTVGRSHAVLAGGLYNISTTIYASDTASNRMSFNNGDIRLSANGGQTIGSIVTPTNRLQYTNSSKTWEHINSYSIFAGNNATTSGNTIYRQTNGGSDLNALVMFENGVTTGAGATSSGIGAGGAFHLYSGNGTKKILGGFLGMIVNSSTAGAESMSLTLNTKGSAGAVLEAMRIDANQNVGIGTGANVVQKLDVWSAFAGIGIRNYNTTTPSSISGGLFLGQSPLATAANQRQLSLAGGGYDGTNSFAAVRIQGMSSEAQVLASNRGGYLNFETTQSGTITLVERMRIENYGTVGINTATPNSNTKLHVNGLVQYGVYTVSTLPTCNSGTANTYATVTDALTPTYLTPVVGGGAIAAPVFCNSSQWVTH